jgi:hypothetical protein
MIIAVAERRAAGDLTERELRALRLIWEEDYLVSTLEARQPRGRFAVDLAALLGGRLPGGILDLLPPDNRPGTREVETARRNASRLAEWARLWGVGLVLLGRRVAGAFGLHPSAPFGEMGFLAEGPPFLLLPHPSARNRWTSRRGNIERWVRTFWTYYSQEMVE